MPAVTETQIANLALGFLDDTRINNIDEDTEPARLCRLHIGHAKRELLEMYPWTIARRLERLTPGQAQEGREWNPFIVRDDRDIMRVVELRRTPQNNDLILRYERHGNVIWTYEREVWLVYVKNILINEMTPLMQQALAWFLASKISQGVGERSAVTYVYQMAMNSISEAWTSDCHQHYSGENYPDFVPHIELIQARQFGGTFDSDPRYLPITGQ